MKKVYIKPNVVWVALSNELLFTASTVGIDRENEINNSNDVLSRRYDFWENDDDDVEE